MKMASLSPEMIKNWDKTGRNDFMKQCIKLIKDENNSLVFEKSGGISNIVSLINDLILNGVRGAMKKEAVVTTLQELVTLHNDIPSVILDILNIADAETLSAELQGGDHSKDRTNFCYVVKECEKFLSDKLLKERLEIDTLQEVGILKNRNFYTKFIKVKTKLYYKQRKFNLFREESEGFAKLVTELNQTFSTNTTHVYLLDIVQSLIGCFNLDPNRVLDIILESFENKPKDSALFIPLIRSYMSDPKTICEVLGSKFTLQRSNSVTSKSLYILTAQLLQHKIIKLDDIYIWLSPEDKSVQKQCERELREAKEYVRRLQIISINQAAESSGSASGGATAATSSSNTTSGGGNSNSSSGGGTDVLGETVEDRYRANQKLGVCEALLEIGDWRTAQELMARMPEHYAVEQQPIALALCRLIHEIVEPVYRRNWKLGTTIPKPPTNIPQLHLENPLAPKPAETFLDLRTHAFPMLLALGPTLRYDSVLMYKIIRIGRASIHLTTGTTNTTNHNDSNSTTTITMDTITTAQNNEDTIYHDMITILDRTILPSLSYLDSNCSIAEEIWSLLKLYPYQSRYCLYSRWKNETHAAYPELLRKRGDAEKQIKNIMKRVSKENIKPVGRFIGKLMHSSPGFLFDYILLQIQVYDNLIHPVVDSLKYLTSLSYDVLGYCLIESLANADKKRVKHDSTSISNWLQSLSGFCGAVFKKYNIELTGLLQYVANQLKAQKSLDLLILKEIVQKMAGIEAAEDLTVEQLNAMSGGELLKVEAGYFSQVRNTKKSSLRLKEAMADQNLAVALCLLISQQKYCVVYRETQRLSHLKLVGKLSDQCQDTLVQFGTFLAGTFSVDEYVKKLPSIQTMLLEYHIPNEVAFFLARPMFNHAITKKYDELRKEDPNYKKMSTVSKHQKYYEAVTAIMTPIHSSVIPLHQPKIWEDISPQFLTTFWSLTMYDLHVPDDTYIQAVNKIKQQSLSNMDSNGGSGGGGNTSKSKKEQERYITLMEKLQEERRKQQEHVDKVLFRLKQEKDNWFMSRPAKSAKNETITRFLQLCIFPRCTFTAIDAVFCAKFVHTLHVLKTANFSTLLCYDRLFCDITYSVVSCTENEAMRYGRFLYSMLETVMRWHGSKDIFDRECANYPGFVTKYRVCNLLCENLDHIGYENFRHVCHKWHYKLARSMISCISSKEYLQIRNALIVLIKIIPFYPVLTNLAQTIEKKVTKMRDEEKSKRQDLFTLAVSYLGQLKQKVQIGHTLSEKDFHIPSEKPGSKANSSGTALTVATTTTTNGKHNGDSNKEPAESHHQKDKETSRDKDKSERKASKVTAVEDGSKSTKTISFDNNSFTDKTAEKEKNSKEGGGGSREWQSRKEEKKEENSNSDRDRERDREKRRERKEEKMLIKEERQYREERFVEAVHKSPKDEMRYSSDRDRYYEERRDNSHYYREPRGGGGEDREVGNGNGGGSGGSFSKHGVESAEPDRDVKRRKTDSQTSKSYAKQQSSSQQSQQQEEPQRKSSSSSSQQQLSQEYGSSSSDKNVSNVAPVLSGGGGGGDKKERSSKMKDKRSEKFTDEEKEQRKEKKLTRKRVSVTDRGDDAALLLAEQHKKRRDEEKALAKVMHQNGELIESPHSKDSREKHHHSREKSPYLRERSHDRVEQRDKHRRPTESKRR